MGIAVGFRERLHLSMDLFERLPPKLLWLSDRFIDGVTFLFGLYLIIYGWDFAMSMRARYFRRLRCLTWSSISSCRSPV